MDVGDDSFVDEKWDGKLLLKPKVLISKRDKQVAEFYLRLRNAWKAKNAAVAADSKISSEVSKAETREVLKSDVNSVTSSPCGLSKTDCSDIQTTPVCHTVRYIPNGRCRRLAIKDCHVRLCSPTKVSAKTTATQPEDTPLLQSLTSFDDLPDLGTGVVDALNDLVPDPVTLLDDDFVSANINGNMLSAEALLEFGNEPEKGVPEDAVWGFSDTDPADWLYTEERDILDDCVETVSRVLRVQTRKPKIVRINQGALRSSVLCEDLTECATLFPVVPQACVSPVLISPALKDVTVAEEQWEGVAPLPSVDMSAVAARKYDRAVHLDIQETTPQVLTSYEVAVEPAQDIKLCQVDGEIPVDPLYESMTCALRIRLHYPISTHDVLEADVRQHYVFRDFHIPLIDLALAQPQFLPRYRPKKKYKTRRHRAELELRATSDAQKFAKEVATTSSESQAPKRTRGRKRISGKVNPQSLVDQKLLSKFEKNADAKSAPSKAPNAFESSNLDALLGSSNLSSVSSPAPNISEEEQRAAHSCMSEEEEESLCISQVWSVPDAKATAMSTRSRLLRACTSSASTNTVSAGRGRLKKMMRFDRSIQTAVAVRKAVQRSDRVPAKLKSLMESHVKSTAKDELDVKPKPVPRSLKEIELAYLNVTALIKSGRANSLKYYNNPMCEFLKAIQVKDAEGLAQALVRGSNLIEVLKRLFIVQLVEMMLISEQQTKCQQKLDQLCIEMRINSEAELKKITGIPSVTTDRHLTEVRSDEREDGKAKNGVETPIEMNERAGSVQNDDAHLSDIYSLMREVGITKSQECSSVMKGNESLIEGSKTDDLSLRDDEPAHFSILPKCEVESSVLEDNVHYVVAKLLSEMTAIVADRELTSCENVVGKVVHEISDATRMHTDNLSGACQTPKLKNPVTVDEVRLVLDSIISEISLSISDAESCSKTGLELKNEAQSMTTIGNEYLKSNQDEKNVFTADLATDELKMTVGEGKIGAHHGCCETTSEAFLPTNPIDLQHTKKGQSTIRFSPQKDILPSTNSTHLLRGSDEDSEAKDTQTDYSSVLHVDNSAHTMMVKSSPTISTYALVKANNKEHTIKEISVPINCAETSDCKESETEFQKEYSGCELEVKKVLSELTIAVEKSIHPLYHNMKTQNVAQDAVAFDAVSAQLDLSPEMLMSHCEPETISGCTKEPPILNSPHTPHPPFHDDYFVCATPIVDDIDASFKQLAAEISSKIVSASNLNADATDGPDLFDCALMGERSCIESKGLERCSSPKMVNHSRKSSADSDLCCDLHGDLTSPKKTNDHAVIDHSWSSDNIEEEWYDLHLNTAPSTLEKVSSNRHLTTNEVMNDKTLSPKPCDMLQAVDSDDEQLVIDEMASPSHKQASNSLYDPTTSNLSAQFFTIESSSNDLLNTQPTSNRDTLLSGKNEILDTDPICMEVDNSTSWNIHGNVVAQENCILGMPKPLPSTHEQRSIFSAVQVDDCPNDILISVSNSPEDSVNNSSPVEEQLHLSDSEPQHRKNDLFFPVPIKPHLEISVNRLDDVSAVPQKGFNVESSNAGAEEPFQLSVNEQPQQELDVPHVVQADHPSAASEIHIDNAATRPQEKVNISSFVVEEPLPLSHDAATQDEIGLSTSVHTIAPMEISVTKPNNISRPQEVVIAISSGSVAEEPLQLFDTNSSQVNNDLPSVVQVKDSSKESLRDFDGTSFSEQGNVNMASLPVEKLFPVSNDEPQQGQRGISSTVHNENHMETSLIKLNKCSTSASLQKVAITLSGSDAEEPIQLYDIDSPQVKLALPSVVHVEVPEMNVENMPISAQMDAAIPPSPAEAPFLLSGNEHKCEQLRFSSNVEAGNHTEMLVVRSTIEDNSDMQSIDQQPCQSSSVDPPMKNVNSSVPLQTLKDKPISLVNSEIASNRQEHFIDTLQPPFEKPFQLSVENQCPNSDCRPCVADPAELCFSDTFHHAEETSSLARHELPTDNNVFVKDVCSEGNRLKLIEPDDVTISDFNTGMEVKPVVSDEFDEFELTISAAYSLQSNEGGTQDNAERLSSSDSNDYAHIYFADYNPSEKLGEDVTVDDVAVSTGLYRVKERIALPQITEDEKMDIPTNFVETMGLDISPEVVRTMEDLVGIVEDKLEPSVVVKSIMNHMVFAITLCDSTLGDYKAKSLFNLYDHSYFNRAHDIPLNEWPKSPYNQPKVQHSNPLKTLSISAENLSLVRQMKLLSITNPKGVQEILQHIAIPSTRSIPSKVFPISIEDLKDLASSWTSNQARKLQQLLRRFMEKSILPLQMPPCLINNGQLSRHSVKAPTVKPPKSPEKSETSAKTLPTISTQVISAKAKKKKLEADVSCLNSADGSSDDDNDSIMDVGTETSFLLSFSQEELNLPANKEPERKIVSKANTERKRRELLRKKLCALAKLVSKEPRQTTSKPYVLALAQSMVAGLKKSVAELRSTRDQLLKRRRELQDRRDFLMYTTKAQGKRKKVANESLKCKTSSSRCKDKSKMLRVDKRPLPTELLPISPGHDCPPSISRETIVDVANQSNHIKEISLVTCGTATTTAITVPKCSTKVHTAVPEVSAKVPRANPEVSAKVPRANPKVSTKVPRAVPATIVHVLRTVPEGSTKVHTTAPVGIVSALTTVPEGSTKVHTTAPVGIVNTLTAVPEGSTKVHTTAPVSIVNALTTVPEGSAKVHTTAPVASAKLLTGVNMSQSGQFKGSGVGEYSSSSTTNHSVLKARPLLIIRRDTPGAADDATIPNTLQVGHTVLQNVKMYNCRLGTFPVTPQLASVQETSKRSPKVEQAAQFQFINSTGGVSSITLRTTNTVPRPVIVVANQSHLQNSNLATTLTTPVKSLATPLISSGTIMLARQGMSNEKEQNTAVTSSKKLPITYPIASALSLKSRPTQIHIDAGGIVQTEVAQSKLAPTSATMQHSTNLIANQSSPIHSCQTSMFDAKLAYCYDTMSVIRQPPVVDTPSKVAQHDDERASSPSVSQKISSMLSKSLVVIVTDSFKAETTHTISTRSHPCMESENEKAKSASAASEVSSSGTVSIGSHALSMTTESNSTKVDSKTTSEVIDKFSEVRSVISPVSYPSSCQMLHKNPTESRSIFRLQHSPIVEDEHSTLLTGQGKKERREAASPYSNWEIADGRIKPSSPSVNQPGDSASPKPCAPSVNRFGINSLKPYTVPFPQPNDGNKLKSCTSPESGTGRDVPMLYNALDTRTNNQSTKWCRISDGRNIKPSFKVHSGLEDEIGDPSTNEAVDSSTELGIISDTQGSDCHPNSILDSGADDNGTAVTSGRTDERKENCKASVNAESFDTSASGTADGDPLVSSNSSMTECIGHSSASSLSKASMSELSEREVKSNPFWRTAKKRKHPLVDSDDSLPTEKKSKFSVEHMVAKASRIFSRRAKAVTGYTVPVREIWTPLYYVSRHGNVHAYPVKRARPIPYNYTFRITVAPKNVGKVNSQLITNTQTQISSTQTRKNRSLIKPKSLPAIALGKSEQSLKRKHGKDTARHLTSENSGFTEDMADVEGLMEEMLNIISRDDKYETCANIVIPLTKTVSEPFHSTDNRPLSELKLNTDPKLACEAEDGMSGLGAFCGYAVTPMAVVDRDSRKPGFNTVCKTVEVIAVSDTDDDDEDIIML